MTMGAATLAPIFFLAAPAVPDNFTNHLIKAIRRPHPFALRSNPAPSPECTSLPPPGNARPVIRLFLTG